MSERHWLDLERLVEGMLSERPVGQGDMAVCGGEFSAGDLEQFLRAWALPRDGMPWSILQWTDRIVPGYRRGLPEDLSYLERGRIFGPEGDLELRRDCGRFLWRFVGEPGTPMPAGFPLAGAQYWKAREGRSLRAYRRMALLWGTRKDAGAHGKTGWHEDRVSRAHLDYPNVSAERVQIHYIEYLDGGDVELVRYLALADKQGGQKGGGNA